ncbi:MAG: protein-L-isoaspartate(D-aspartate) O-methyltransferase [Campylobacter sp.]|uniref:protein-L-isoaspartate(D-aspartate) O-methyltransferase n=1 Tax=unclassified Campylobacter TaxID=2593542 RepID=UPI0022E9FCEB|nr:MULTISPECIES: protein-L-isoaspartate(D-aspartate) O-methyltransferase [unclassified Campylobacter]MBQ2430762.1 protein-L-isoaspartate(D-aspartate) O-methyltransferase [Campylobacter sp.]MDA3079455.1 protein-L-isoaspartate(D-aspartate) O-methyltransferase [Campylobacter sp. CS_NA2]WBR50928.1 protein-L-isoaspartate(D-aspartate) O-methyltransferase [Campylobacter sp. CS_NA3]
MQPLEKARCAKMADEIADKIQISPNLYEAFCAISRSEFVPVSAYAFSLNAQPILGNQWISSPLTVAKMTMALELENADSVLEIGCGSGYQAAILSKIVRRVFTIERIERLVKEAKKHFANLNLSNINVRYDDGNAGWKDYAPYDRILLSAAAKQIDKRLFDQLTMGGILVAPIEKNGVQQIIKFTKMPLPNLSTNGALNFDKTGEKSYRIVEKIIESCEFVPLLSGRE